MTNLQILYSQFGQSPWLDNLSREMLNNGKIEDFISQGIRGLTSNPTIFEKALTSSAAYDEAISQSQLSASSAEDLYWQLANADIQRTADLLRPTYDESNHLDGYVSLEVSPNLAQDAEATITEAHDLWAKVDRPNLMVKIPATEACIPVIKQLIADGLNINVTLIFTLDRYKEVVESYLSGLEACTQPLDSVHSVASFFISRIDSEIDPRLETIGSEQALGYRGKAAVAQGQLAYEIFNQTFSTSNERWTNLLAKGANEQRPLWASTSTKNPSYDPLLYIKDLIAANTVSTIPDATIVLIEDTVGSVTTDGITPESINNSRQLLGEINSIGVDLSDVGRVLEQQGLEKFQVSFKTMLGALSSKMSQ